MPVNYADYAPNWFTEIRPAILERAGNRCEGSPLYPDCRAENGQPHLETGGVVNLAVCHRDHDTSRNDYSNLAAWCNRCHLAHDAKHRAGNRKRTMMALDNSTFEQKVTLRREALKLAGDSPVIMETHGGTGKLFEACYLGQRRGVVFELDGKRAAILAAQRPTWAVYEADCVRALRLGAGGHLEVNLLDLDPHGSPWAAIEAFFSSDRPRPGRVVVVVNDGLRGRIKLGIAWKTEAVLTMVAKYGNELYENYLDICQELLQEKAAKAGYKLGRFWGYYLGGKSSMTHYLGVLEQG